MPATSIFSVPPGLSHADRQLRRHALLRLGWAWLAMMQVMMFAWPGYVRHDGIPPDALATLDWAIVLMNWASLALTLPVALYSAWPVWQGAARSLHRRQAGMDVPVALGIVAAFLPSVHATVTQRGEVYFDSVTMFVAFLLTARYLALCARQSVAPRHGRVQAWRHARLEIRRRALGASADRVAARFVAAQVALALAAAAVWAWLDPAHAVPVMVALLVISCPCAMAMAVPTTLAAAHAAAQPGLDAQQFRALLAATRRVAGISLYGSLAWHLLLTPLALAGWVAPWLAATTMLLSSLAVAGCAWHLYRRYRALAAVGCAAVTVSVVP
ncbi:hypothetical protein [Bordetella sp. BOR01]|uniref:P-type ATPase n=1 Tax=Bordetella sp. BOR01 TaxID=2854779 RepID=UPI001C491F90|nr:hypothetical protein [Bordetella sp. BOR01]MBV7486899.1 hypothetical protein [Bordetella sp. BOR01]